MSDGLPVIERAIPQPLRDVNGISWGKYYSVSNIKRERVSRGRRDECIANCFDFSWKQLIENYPDVAKGFRAHILPIDYDGSKFLCEDAWNAKGNLFFVFIASELRLSGEKDLESE